MPIIPDHELLRVIGKGSYGVVWLARNVLGKLRAAKAVYRERFDSDRPYEREFRGIECFEPISRTHPSFVSILQVGRNDLEAYFYYIMELADDAEQGAEFEPDGYVPCTLTRVLERQGRLPLQEVLRVGLLLTAGLGHLHHRGLLHRDIKPSNIIFVDGQPKFADIGLVTQQARTGTVEVGTEGYMPQHGGGTTGADLYSLGKVLYEMYTGKDRLEYPALPTNLGASEDLAGARELNEIILKACAPNPQSRFQSAREMFDELSRVQRTTQSDVGSGKRWYLALWPHNEPPVPQEQPRLEAIGGAVPLDSAFYVLRREDAEFQAAVGRLDSIVLVKGARQMGKTSLLARGLQQARDVGAQIILTDLQLLNDSQLGSLKDFYIAVARGIADQLETTGDLSDCWDERRGPNHNFERYFRRLALAGNYSHVFWGVDEVDRLFTTNFGGQVFGMFRAWHNRRALDPGGPWSHLTLAIAYATEAHLFITDINQSPFNVGTRIVLEDFALEQVAELNQRYGNALPAAEDRERFFRLLGGQPYLVRRGLHEIVTRNLPYDEFEHRADHDDSVFGDHLRRIRLALDKDESLVRAVREVLGGRPCPSQESFYRLRSAGVLTGDSAKDARARCQLYEKYLRRQLL